MIRIIHCTGPKIKGKLFFVFLLKLNKVLFGKKSTDLELQLFLVDNAALLVIEKFFIFLPPMKAYDLVNSNLLGISKISENM